MVLAAVLVGRLPEARCQEKEETLPQVVYAAEDLRDPFKSYIVTEVKAEVSDEPVDTEVLQPLPVFSVQGVFWGGLFPQAIVNDKIVKEGDVIEGARIVNISRENVRFNFANREFGVSVATLAAGIESRKEEQ